MLRLTFVLVLIGLSGVRADEFDDFIRAEQKRQQVPGVTVGIVKDGKIIKAEGYGLANVEHNVPAKRETVYQLGSVGKQFAAMGALLLVEEGKLKLDDPVSKHLSDTPEAWKDITVRHLLTHTSGIPEYTHLVDLQKNATETDLLKKAASLPLDFKPGEKWSYSNTGYAVLGFLLSKAAEKFYGDYLGEKIFKPLEMTSTRIINEADIIPHRAAGYHFVNGKLKNQEWVAPRLNTTADGSLYTTIDDMFKWDAALAAGKLIAKEHYEAMWTPVKTADGKKQVYGFGWNIDAVKGHKRQSHGGAWQGFTTYIERYPDDKVSVIVLTNSAPGRGKSPGSQPGRIASGLAALVVPELGAKPGADSKPNP